MEQRATTFEPASLWWSEIAGPSSFVAKMEEILAEGTPVISVISYSLPFRQVFRGEVCDRAVDLGLVPHIIEFDSCYNMSDEDVGETLLQKFGKANDLLPEYIRQKRSPKFLNKCGAFNSKLIWIKGLSKNRLTKWLKFISGFHSKSNVGLESGFTAFVVEVIDASDLPDRLPENLSRINYSDYIKEDDLHLFTSMLVENRLGNENSSIKRYVTEVITSLCGVDCEVADAMVREDAVSRDPIELLKEVKNEFFADSPRGGDDPSHPFSILKNHADDSLVGLVWKAQLRTAFPLIEHERLCIIKLYEHEIESALKTEPFYDFEGERILNPYDVEIGLINRLSHMRGSDGLYLLYISDESMRDRITLLRSCRNQLAHMNICDQCQIGTLLYNEQT